MLDDDYTYWSMCEPVILQMIQSAVTFAVSFFPLILVILNPLRDACDLSEQGLHVSCITAVSFPSKNVSLKDQCAFSVFLFFLQVLHVPTVLHEILCPGYFISSSSCTHPHAHAHSHTHSWFSSREEKLDSPARISFWKNEISTSHWAASRHPGAVYWQAPWPRL